MNAAGSVSIPASLAFLVFNVGILLVILALNRRAGPSSRRQAAGGGIQATGPEQTARTEKPLAASDILGWEFEYARVTASEANAERHTMSILSAGGWGDEPQAFWRWRDKRLVRRNLSAPCSYGCSSVSGGWIS